MWNYGGQRGTTDAWRIRGLLFAHLLTVAGCALLFGTNSQLARQIVRHAEWVGTALALAVFVFPVLAVVLVLSEQVTWRQRIYLCMTEPLLVFAHLFALLPGVS